MILFQLQVAMAVLLSLLLVLGSYSRPPDGAVSSSLGTPAILNTPVPSSPQVGCSDVVVTSSQDQMQWNVTLQPLTTCDYIQLRIECDGVCIEDWGDGVEFMLLNPHSSTEAVQLYHCNYTVGIQQNSTFMDCAYGIILARRIVDPCGNLTEDPSSIFCDISRGSIDGVATSSTSGPQPLDSTSTSAGHTSTSTPGNKITSASSMEKVSMLWLLATGIPIAAAVVVILVILYICRRRCLKNDKLNFTNATQTTADATQTTILVPTTPQRSHNGAPVRQSTPLHVRRSVTPVTSEGTPSRETTPLPVPLIVQKGHPTDDEVSLDSTHLRQRVRQKGNSYQHQRHFSPCEEQDFPRQDTGSDTDSDIRDTGSTLQVERTREVESQLQIRRRLGSREIRL